MCPICLTTAAVSAVAVATTTGSVALLATKLKQRMRTAQTRDKRERGGK